MTRIAVKNLYFVQTIRFHLENGMIIEGSLASYEGPFGAIVTFPPLYTSRRGQAQMFPPVATPDLAFAWLLEAAIGHADRVESPIEKITNPGGALYFEPDEQLGLLAAKGLGHVPALLNGS